MTKDEARSAIMGAISMALKDPTLQQGFEIICKENANLERKLEQTEKDLADYQFNYPTIKELQKENANLKALKKYELNVAKLEIEKLEKENESLINIKNIYIGDLLKAKEIIRELLNSCFGYNSKTVNYEVKVKAEQFLEDVSE